MHSVESPRADDAGIEQRIRAAGKTAARVTPADLEANIAETHFFTAADGVLGSGVAEGVDNGATPPLFVLTFCVLVLRNGFTVTGESAPASPENFDEAIGRDIALANAKSKCWPLMGYALKQRLYEQANTGYTNESIARMAHEVNRAYCLALGDTSQPAWEDAPEWQRESAMLGVALHLGNPNAGPQASHESWMRQKVADGWNYGPTKDPEAKLHPCIVPFDELPREQQAKDYLFRGVVHAMARR